MTEEQKIELLKNKFQQIIAATMQKDPKADTIFLAFFNAVKDNDALWESLQLDRKQQLVEEETKLQTRLEQITVAKAQVDELIAVVDTKPAK